MAMIRYDDTIRLIGYDDTIRQIRYDRYDMTDTI